MSQACNIVRFQVKPGCEGDFISRFQEIALEAGQSSGILVDTGDGGFCFVGLWVSQEALAAARPAMIGNLDEVRDLLEELSPELGITDPRSGLVVAER